MKETIIDKDMPMITHENLQHKNLYEAFLQKSSEFEGTCMVCVKTTGIFCRLTCNAKTPRRENVEFAETVRDALQHGYRPCKRCRPMNYAGEEPEWMGFLMKEVTGNPEMKLSDDDLKQRGLQPGRVRRWFKRHYGMTFHAYRRMLRINRAFGQIREGERVTSAAFDSGYDSLSGFTESFKRMTGFSPVQSPHKKVITISRILTPLGPMVAGLTDKGLCLLEFSDRKALRNQILSLQTRLKARCLPGQDPRFGDLEKQLEEYFAGKRKNFNMELILAGSEFQKTAWRELVAIPYGETRTYEQQARAVGNPNAVRAVARANGDNRIAIIIPCHRVIGKDGKLVGYGGGLKRKEFLLNLERNG